MVKVLRSFVRGPLEPHVIGFAEDLFRQGYTRSSAGQHVCFIAHLDRWMSAAGVGLGELSGPVIGRCQFHYADLRIMPRWPWIPLQGRGFGLMRSA